MSFFVWGWGFVVLLLLFGVGGWISVGRGFTFVVSIEFSPLSTVELTTNWYHLHNGDYLVIILS